MKKLLQRLALFGFVGCLALVGIAAHRFPNMKYKKQWKAVFSTKEEETKESLVATTRDNSYELYWPGKMFRYFID
jgi:hypothetical protein